MNPNPPHFIVEEGPDRGRELTIPADGARIGRATENDIVMADASMSRFQCRAYFKDNFLHVMDLGSTNATMVNDLEISDTPLRHGDHMLIGETLLRVVNDGLSEAQRAAAAGLPADSGVHFQPTPPPSPPAPAPAAPPLPAVEPVVPAGPPDPGSETAVDLGFGKRQEQERRKENEQNVKRSSLSLVLTALVSLLITFGVGAVYLMATQKQQRGIAVPKDESVQIYYEKVIGSRDNLFRYALSLQNGELAVEIHDLSENRRDIRRAEKLNAVELKKVRDELLDQQANFVKLRPVYDGAADDRYEIYDLTLVLGRRAHQVRVENQLEPATFKQVRESIEAMADNRLGLATLVMDPRELRAQADNAWKVGVDLYNRRNVKDDNLWEAIKKMREIAWLVDTIEPKPPYFREAMEQKQGWETELQTRRDELWFAAQREARIGNYRDSITYLAQLLAAQPDAGDDLWEKARKSKVELEQLLK